MVQDWDRDETYTIRCVLVSSIQYAHRTVLYADRPGINQLQPPKSIVVAENGPTPRDPYLLGER